VQEKFLSKRTADCGHTNLHLIMSENSDTQAPQRFSSEYQVALLKHLSTLNDPPRRAPGSATNSLLISTANDGMLGRVSQLSMPLRTASSALDYVHEPFQASRLPLDRMAGASRPRPEFDAALSMLRRVDQLPMPPSATATAMDRVYASFAMPEQLPLDRMLDATLPHLTENQVDVILQRLLVTRQDRQQRSLLRESQLSEIMLQELRGRVAAPLSQALAFGALTTSALYVDQEPLRRSSLWHPDRVPFPMNSESVLSPAFQPEWAFTVPDRVGAHQPGQPHALALAVSDHVLQGRAAGTQAGMRCSREGEAPLGEIKRKRKHNGETFPVILHRLLLDVESLGCQNIISFTPSGRAFRVHKPDSFMKEIAPKYFRQQFFSSFTRQLNTYGFDKLASWPDEGAFAHAQFQREKPELCKHINAREPEDYRDTRDPLYPGGGDG
jgi:hypothetical protein